MTLDVDSEEKFATLLAEYQRLVDRSVREFPTDRELEAVVGSNAHARGTPQQPAK